MPESDRFGRYKIRGGGGNILSVGIPSGSRVKVSIRCDVGATAQQSVTSQCSNGTWIPPWPRCGKQLALNDDFIFSLTLAFKDRRGREREGVEGGGGAGMHRSIIPNRIF